MNRRANILGRLRRWRTGAARYVVASFAVAYLSAGVAPCAAAAGRAIDDAQPAAREHGAAREGRAHHGHDAHGAAAGDVSAPTPADDPTQPCAHCPAPASMAHADDHASCAALADLTNVAASHLKDVPQPLAPSFGPAPFTLPPSLASPAAPPPSRTVRISPVPLNVRHCVFLI